MSRSRRVRPLVDPGRPSGGSRLRGRGVRVALDDSARATPRSHSSGTSRSTCVKMAKEFVNSLQDSTGESIIVAIVRSCGCTQSRVVAEGIETREPAESSRGTADSDRGSASPTPPGTAGRRVPHRGGNEVHCEHGWRARSRALSRTAARVRFDRGDLRIANEPTDRAWRRMLSGGVAPRRDPGGDGLGNSLASRSGTGRNAEHLPRTRKVLRST